MEIKNFEFGWIINELKQIMFSKIHYNIVKLYCFHNFINNTFEYSANTNPIGNKEHTTHWNYM